MIESFRKLRFRWKMDFPGQNDFLPAAGGGEVASPRKRAGNGGFKPNVSRYQANQSQISEISRGENWTFRREREKKNYLAALMAITKERKEKNSQRQQQQLLPLPKGFIFMLNYVLKGLHNEGS